MQSQELLNIPSKDRPAVSGKKNQTTGMMNAFSAANTRKKNDDGQDRLIGKKWRQRVPIYVRQLILLNDGPVTITTIKLNIQLLAVENALAGARIRSPTISAG